jgi:hypothetical protein
MSEVVFVDTETTGLDHDRHEVWDIALIDDDGEHEWHIRPQNLHDADEGALRITHYYERVAAAGFEEKEVTDGYPAKTRTVRYPKFWSRTSRQGIASEIAVRTAGKHLVGAVPWFDARFLAGLLHREGFTPAWHYHMVDVEALAVGWLAGGAGRVWSPERAEPERSSYQPPWNSDGLSFALGVATPKEDRHTAIGDARWAKAMYEAVMGK